MPDMRCLHSHKGNPALYLLNGYCAKKQIQYTHRQMGKQFFFSFLLLSDQFCEQTNVNLQNCVRFFPSICFYCNFSRILIGKKLVELLELNIITLVRIFLDYFFRNISISGGESAEQIFAAN